MMIVGQHLGEEGGRRLSFFSLHFWRGSPTNTSYFFFFFSFFFLFLGDFFFPFFASFLHEDNKEEKTRKRMFGGEHLQTRSEENQRKTMNTKNKRQIIGGIPCRTIPK
jgi:hypothetical protein